MQNTIFGLTEPQITELGMTYGVPFFMAFMVFIVAHLAWKSRAGKFGTFILFLALCLGLIGFIAKYVIQKSLGV